MCPSIGFCHMTVIWLSYYLDARKPFPFHFCAQHMAHLCPDCLSICIPSLDLFGNFFPFPCLFGCFYPFPFHLCAQYMFPFVCTIYGAFVSGLFVHLHPFPWSVWQFLSLPVPSLACLAVSILSLSICVHNIWRICVEMARLCWRICVRKCAHMEGDPSLFAAHLFGCCFYPSLPDPPFPPWPPFLLFIFL